MKKACPRCRNAVRWKYYSYCESCYKNYQREYASSHKEAKRRYGEGYYEREGVKAERKKYGKMYYKKNKETLLSQNRAYKSKNIDKINVQRKKYYEGKKKEAESKGTRENDT